MSGGSPYRGSVKIQAFTRVFKAEYPETYPSKVREAAQFINRLLEAGVKRSDIREFPPSTMISYERDLQVTTTFLTILYYHHFKID